MNIRESMIARVLSGELPTTCLTDDEYKIWRGRFTELMGRPGPEEEAYFAELRRRRQRVGQDKDGNLVCDP